MSTSLGCLSQPGHEYMSSRRCGLIVKVAEVLGHSSFHRELDQVERNEPNDVLPKARQNKM